MAKRTRPAIKKKSTSSQKVNRKLAAPKYRSFKLNKRIKHHNPTIKSAPVIFKAACKVLWRNKKLFGGIVLVYLILDVILVKGFGSTSNIPELKHTLQSLFRGNTAQLTTGLTLFGLLLGSAGSTPTAQASSYQTILLLIISLVLIWALRQTLAKVKVGIRDAFYKSLYPVIPFLLVLVVISLQLFPLLIANFLYGAVFTNGLAVSPIEKGLWAMLLILLAMLSLYMVCSSIFALYIVTLPNVRPIQALKSARELVRYRRWAIIRKLLFLPFILLILVAAITMPLILFLPAAAEWVFFVLTMLSLALVHSYMYNLYRELL